ncbi:hypothetical protein ACLK1S_26375 [Escherichia coli]
MKTLGEFIVEKAARVFSHATGELTALLSAINRARRLSIAISTKQDWFDILGASGAENVQGEVQQRT